MSSVNIKLRCGVVSLIFTDLFIVGMTNIRVLTSQPILVSGVSVFLGNQNRNQESRSEIWIPASRCKLLLTPDDPAVIDLWRSARSCETPTAKYLAVTATQALGPDNGQKCVFVLGLYLDKQEFSASYRHAGLVSSSRSSFHGRFQPSFSTHFIAFRVLFVKLCTS